MKLADLNPNLLYTYADYLKWQFEERVELIRGKIFAMSGPNRAHQEISSYLHLEIGNYLKGKDCKVYSAPFDVRLPRKSKEDKDIVTVVQPDLCVICDRSILDFKGCLGAPDIVVEITSPSNNITELKNKYDIYEEAGVKEYWIVSPQDNYLMVYTLINGKYHASRLMVAGDVFHSSVLEGFSLNLKDMFDSLD